MTRGQFLDMVNGSLGEILRDYEYLSNVGEAFDMWLGFNCSSSKDLPTEFLLVDGTGDKGIDAVWIDEGNEEFIIIQGKWSSSGRATYPDTPIRSLILAPSLLENSATCERLKPEISEASDKYNNYVKEEGYKVKLVFAHTGSLTQQAKEEVQSYKDKNEHILEVYDWQALERHWEERNKDRPEEITLDVKGNEIFLSHDDNGDVAACVSTVTADSLKRQVADNFGIFEENVRGFLGYRKGTPNYDMSSTINNEPSKFWSRNNGLTITCDSIECHDAEGTKRLRLRMPQIVNGCQTTTIINKSQCLDDVSVLVRIITSTSQDDIRKITEATNKQSSVDSRDFRSKDPVQKAISDYFVGKNYFYDFRRGSWDRLSQDERTRYKRADNFLVAKAVLSYLGEPADAKNKRRLLFITGNTGKYDKIFACPPSLLFLSYYIFDLVESQKYKFNRMEGVLFRNGQTEEEKLAKQRQNIYVAHSVEHFTYAIMYLIENAYGDLRSNAQTAIGELAAPNEAMHNWLYGFVILPIKDATQSARESGIEERKIFINPDTVKDIKQKIDDKNEEYLRDENRSFAQRFCEKMDQFDQGT